MAKSEIDLSNKSENESKVLFHEGESSSDIKSDSDSICQNDDDSSLEDEDDSILSVCQEL